MDDKLQKANRSLQFFERHLKWKEIIFVVLVGVCCSSFVTPALALLMGIGVAQLIGNPYEDVNHKITHFLLQLSVVGLGFGMDLESAYQAGKEGFLLAVVSIFSTLALGYAVGRLLKIDAITSFLIAAGTAICGGSAIAAIAPTIQAKEKHLTVSLGIIFMLNAVSMYIFPLFGQLFQLSQTQFGIWSAIAIQDTSSVIGAATKYGPEALKIATTVKLTRALWIIPLTLLAAKLFKQDRVRIKIPYFIGLFILAMILNTYLPSISNFSPIVVTVSKVLLTVTLFLIGSGLTSDLLQGIGLKPMLQGMFLWLFIAIIGLGMVLYFV
ncbi:YeiH family protein [Sphingobacterium sp. LRF_L2]|uniref:YeiH family protein n=1 Tax=Sphingobacterium sp. LRF_L2 TaxID=3369421 RepID=UPI003F648D9E